MDNRETIPGYKYFLDAAGARPEVFVDVPEPRAAPGRGAPASRSSVSADELEALDARERNYARVEVTSRSTPTSAAACTRTWAAEARARSTREGRVVARAYLEAGPAGLAGSSRSSRSCPGTRSDRGSTCREGGLRPLAPVLGDLAGNAARAAAGSTPPTPKWSCSPSSRCPATRSPRPASPRLRRRAVVPRQRGRAPGKVVVGGSAERAGDVLFNAAAVVRRLRCARRLPKASGAARSLRAVVPRLAAKLLVPGKLPEAAAAGACSPRWPRRSSCRPRAGRSASSGTRRSTRAPACCAASWPPRRRRWSGPEARHARVRTPAAPLSLRPPVRRSTAIRAAACTALAAGLAAPLVRRRLRLPAARRDGRGRDGPVRAVRRSSRARARATSACACCRCGPTSPPTRCPTTTRRRSSGGCGSPIPSGRPRDRRSGRRRRCGCSARSARPGASRAGRSCSSGRTGCGSCSRTAPSLTCSSATASSFPRGAAQIYATFDLGVIGYWAIPTAPPWYAAAQGLMDDGRTPELRRMMVEYGEQFWKSGWAPLYGVLGGNPLAAMPSLHFATSVTAAHVLTETGARRRRRSAGRTPRTLGVALVYLGRALRRRPRRRPRARRGRPRAARRVAAPLARRVSQRRCRRSRRGRSA